MTVSPHLPLLPSQRSSRTQSLRKLQQAAGSCEKNTAGLGPAHLFCLEKSYTWKENYRRHVSFPIFIIVQSFHGGLFHFSKSTSHMTHILLLVIKMIIMAAYLDMCKYMGIYIHSSFLYMTYIVVFVFF